MKIRRDDRVIVMAGKDIRAHGRVIRVDAERQRVLVEGVNKIKRHEKVRPTQRGGQTGGITEKENWVHVSNVQLWCSAGSHPTRVAHDFEEGNKRRVCAKCGAAL